MTSAPAVITSADNPRYRRLRALVDDPREVRKQGRTVLAGSHLVAACLDAGHSVKQVLLPDLQRTDAEVATLRRRCGNVEQTTFAPGLYRELLAMPSSCGIAVEIELPMSRPHIANAAVLALDGVQDTGNVGTLLRTAAAAGVVNIALGRGCAGAWSSKVLRAGQGAQFQLHLIEGVDLPAWLAAATLPVTGAVADGGQPVYKLDLRAPRIWVFGSEGQGLSPGVAHCVDTPVTIPIASAVESLNVAAAAAVCLFEARRQQLAGSSPALERRR